MFTSMTRTFATSLKKTRRRKTAIRAASFPPSPVALPPRIAVVAALTPRFSDAYKADSHESVHEHESDKCKSVRKTVIPSKARDLLFRSLGTARNLHLAVFFFI